VLQGSGALIIAANLSVMMLRRLVLELRTWIPFLCPYPMDFCTFRSVKLETSGLDGSYPLILIKFSVGCLLEFGGRNVDCVDSPETQHS